jgi:hypothetical protein
VELAARASGRLASPRIQFAQQPFDLLNMSIRLGQSRQRHRRGASRSLEKPALKTIKSLLLLPLLALPLAGCGSSEPLYDGQPLSAYMAALDDPDPALKEYAHRTLIRFGPEDPKVVAALIAALKGGNFTAASLLAEIGPLSPQKGEVVAALTEVVQKSKQNTSLRFAATKALPKFGEDAKPAMPALIEMLGENDEDMQTQAAETLGKLHIHAKDAVVPLVNVARNATPRAQRAALEAIKEIDEKTYNKLRAGPS